MPGFNSIKIDRCEDASHKSEAAPSTDTRSFSLTKTEFDPQRRFSECWLVGVWYCRDLNYEEYYPVIFSI